MTLLGSTSSIKGFVVELDEGTGDLFLGNLTKLNHAELSWCGALGTSLDLQLMVGTLDLTKGNTIGRSRQNDTTDLRLSLKVVLVDLVDTINDQRLTSGAIESSAVLGTLSNTTKDNSTDRHLAEEVIILIVTELVKTSSHAGVVTDLDEAASL